MRIGVDLDGTLCYDVEDYTSENFRCAIPRLDIIKQVNALYDDGHHIIIWTGRGEEHRDITHEWLTKHSVKFHKLVMNKLRLDKYMDESKKLIVVSDCNLGK